MTKGMRSTKMQTCAGVCGILVLALISITCLVGEDKPMSSTYFVNSLGMKMIHVQAGPFDAWTPSFADHEKAVTEVSGGLERPPIPHRVELPGDYYLAEFPVTNQMYRQFVEETGHREPGGEMFDMDRIKTGQVATWLPASEDQGVTAGWELEGFAGDSNAVAGLNYHDAVAFCEWLSEKEGRQYRLPEVYEWEYACRAGTDTLFWWGDRPDVRYMNYAASRIGHPTPVGSYPPNPWGFYDMHGNVTECCEQIGRPGGVQKGGAWNYPGGLLGADVYVDVRGTFTPHIPIRRRLMSIGFRLACDAGEGKPHPGDLKEPTVLPAQPEGPNLPELEITVGERIDLGPIPTNAAFFMVTHKGTWILNNKRSTDQGKTWQPCSGLSSTTAQLRDGTIMACSGPGNITGGKGTLNVRISTDDWESIEEFAAPVEIPLGKRYWAYEGLLELDDGSLLMTLYGWMDGDQVREDNPMFPIADEAYKTRVIAVKSSDGGRSWKYLSTICYHPEMGREGADETTIIKLPTGDIFAAMRTGLHGYRDKLGRESLDEPLLVTWSRCNGEKWAEPERIYVKDRLVTGIFPQALLTAENVLAVLRTRPEGSVVFNPDGTGTIWTDEVVFTDPHGAMDDMALIGPNTLMVAYVTGTGGNWRAMGLPITVRKKSSR